MYIKIGNIESKRIEIKEYAAKVKKENESFNDKIEIIRLKEIIEKIKKENSKIPKIKLLVEEYKKVLKQKDEQIIKLRENNKSLYEYVQKIPTFIRKIFTKESNLKLLDK